MLNPEIGKKDDKGKLQWWYMDNFWKQMEQVVEVLTMGDKKYPSPTGDNWKHVEDGRRRYNDALLRHTLSYRTGEKVDPESNKSHLAHVITNALFLMWLDDQASKGIVHDDATIEAILKIIDDLNDNATNYSSIYSIDSDRQVADALTSDLIDQIYELKGK